MEGLITLILIVLLIQLLIIVLLVFFYRQIKFLLELESECIRFDIQMIKMAVMNKFDLNNLNKPVIRAEKEITSKTF